MSTKFSRRTLPHLAMIRKRLPLILLLSTLSFLLFFTALSTRLFTSSPSSFFTDLFLGKSDFHIISTQNEQFEHLTRALFCQEIASNTISLHYTLQNPKEYGIEEVIPTFGNISTDGTCSGIVLENTLRKVENFPEHALSVDNRLTKQVLQNYLQSSLEGLPYTMYQEPLSTVNGVQCQIPILLSEFRLESEDDVQMYLDLVDTLPAYFQSVIAFEEEKSKQGLFMSNTVAEQVIAQCQAFIEMGNANYLITTFVDKIKQVPDLDGEKKDLYIEENAKAVTETMTNAFKNLRQGVEKLKGTGKHAAGLCHYPKGKEYYSYLARQQTGTDRSVTEMKDMTKKQILDDLKSMEQELGMPVSAQISTNEIPIAHAITPGQQDISTEEAASGSRALSMLQDLQEKSRHAFPKSPETNAQIKYVPASMEQVLSPAFYMIPPIDNISENVIYVNQSQVQNELSLYTTLAHEGYPGHLYQTVYYANQNLDAIRSILNYGGYTEGWATYAEMMSYYLAPIAKTQALLCQKNASIILGLYALADIGIHSDGWLVKDASKFFQTYGITDQAVVLNIYNLILGAPGNYLKYYIGYLEFLDIKKDAMKRMGNAFSQQDFHDVVLKTGPAPFEIVRKQVDAWITSGQE